MRIERSAIQNLDIPSMGKGAAEAPVLEPGRVQSAADDFDISTHDERLRAHRQMGPTPLFRGG